MKTIRVVSNAMLFASLVLAVSWSVTAAPKGGQAKNVGVEVEFDDIAGDGVQSDGDVYFKTKRNKVKAHIEQQDGQLHLNTWDSRDRSIQLIFPEFAVVDCFPVFEESGPYVHANLTTLGIDLLAMAPEQVEYAQVRITFPDLVNDHWYLFFDVLVTRMNEVTWYIATLDGIAELQDPERPPEGTIPCGFLEDMPFGITVRILE